MKQEHRAEVWLRCGEFDEIVSCGQSVDRKGEEMSAFVQNACVSRAQQATDQIINAEDDAGPFGKDEPRRDLSVRWRGKQVEGKRLLAIAARFAEGKHLAMDIVPVPGLVVALEKENDVLPIHDG